MIREITFEEAKKLACLYEIIVTDTNINFFLHGYNHAIQTFLIENQKKRKIKTTLIVGNIITSVENYSNLSLSAIQSRRRYNYLCELRTCIVIALKFLNYSENYISEIINRDHSNVHHLFGLRYQAKIYKLYHEIFSELKYLHYEKRN